MYALFYQFSGAAGDAVVIEAARLSGDLDPVLVLHDAADNALPDGENDDATGETRDARLTYTLPADGTYIIAVTRYGVRDRELERRGHRFVRYADDCNIYVRSERAGQRVMESNSRFITQKLKLKVNEAKSAVARPQERKFLGFSFTAGPDIKRTIAPKSLDRFKQQIRDITRRAKGVSIKTTMEELVPYMRGWRGYFGFCETPEVWIALTRWVRLRLRAALWRQWKTPRRRRAALIALRKSRANCSIRPEAAVAPGTSHGAKPSLSGFQTPTSNCSVSQPWSKRVSATARTAVYGPVRTVVWEGRSRKAPPYPDQWRKAAGRRNGGDQMLNSEVAGFLKANLAISP